MEVRVCSCGRIHVFPKNKIDNAIYNNKELLLVCGGCGSRTVIGADYHAEGAYGFEAPCYDMYSLLLIAHSVSRLTLRHQLGMKFQKSYLIMALEYL